MTFTTDRNQGPPPASPWGILATLAWMLLAFLISLGVATGVFSVWSAGADSPKYGTYDGTVIAIGTIASIPVQVAVLAFAVQLRRWTPGSYLALNVPRRAEIIVAVICILALNAAFDALLYVTGHELVPAFQAEAYRTAKEAGSLLGLMLAIVVFAPVGEEIAFRGFLYRGLVRPGREIHVIVIVALAWALLHIQYDWIGMAQVFAGGLVLGWFRWASGSTTVTIVMHVLINLQAMLETWIKMEWLS